MWWTLACSGLRAAEGPPAVEAAPLLDAPWVDPRLTGGTDSREPQAAHSARVTAWFDRQLLPTGDAYPAFVERFRDAERHPLRAAVIGALKAASEASWAAARPALARLEEAGVLVGCHRQWIVNAVTCDLPRGDPAPLAAVPGVRLVFRVPEPEARKTAAVGPADVTDLPVAAPFVASGAKTYWNLERLRIPDVWDRGLTGAGVLVAVHDDGFALDLPPIAGTIWRNPGEVPRNGLDDDDDGYADDVHGFAFDRGDAQIEYVERRPGKPIHGSLVVATIAGREVDGRTLGGAPDARWMALTGDEIAEPVEYALDHGADIYSMSFSLPNLGDYRAHWRKVLEQAAAAGLIIVDGAGNFGDPRSDAGEPIPVQMRIPEDIPLAVITLSGIGWSGERPPFSSMGPVQWDVVHYHDGLVDKPDLATVNLDAPALWPDGSVRTGRGNSYAGPHLAGVLALLLQADPELTPWAARDLLIATAVDLGAPGFDPEYGHGFVDAAAAVRALKLSRAPLRPPRGG